MALTKVGSIGVSTGIQFAGVTTIATLNASDNILSVGGTVNFVSDVSIGGTISIGGTLTYEDVTNIDSVGLVTARNGIVVGSGITLSKDGDIFFTGIITGNGSGLTNTGPSLTGSTDNTVVTVTGANAIQGESTLTYDGSELKILKSSGATVTLENTGNAGVTLRGDADRSGADDYIFTLDGRWNGTSVAAIRFESGADTTNKDDGIISFWTAPSGTKSERLRIASDGKILIGTTTEGHDAADDVTIATTGNTGITIRSGSTSNGSIYFSDATSGTGEYTGQIDYDHNNNSLNFYADNTQCLRLINDGSVAVSQKLTLPNGTVSLNQDSVGIGTTMTAGRNAGVSTAEGTILYNSEIQQVQCFTGSVWKNVGSLVEDTSTGHYATLTAAATDGLDHYWPGSSSKSLISNLSPNERKGNPHFNNRGGVGVSTLTNSSYGASFPYFFFADQDDGTGVDNSTGYRYTAAEDWTGGDFSICFWICVMQEDTDGEGTAVQLGNHNGTGSLFAVAHTAALQGKTVTIGVDNADDGIAYEHANWMHVGVSYDHSVPSATYYKNGVATETHTFSQALDVGTGTPYIYLGYGYWNSSSSNKEACSLMSDIGIWDNKALSGTEIKSIYDNKRIVKGY